MVSKRFIDNQAQRYKILELLQQEYLSKDYYSEKIEVKLDLSDLVEEQIVAEHIVEPVIYITVNAYQKIQELVHQASGEVSWHCLVEPMVNTNIYLIYDVLVFPQIVTGTTTNGVDGDYEMWLANLPDEQFEHCRCHMHSHVNMGVTPSCVDENYYSNLMTHVTDYYITMVINKKNDYHLRFYDKANNILYLDKELIVCFEDGGTLLSWYDSVSDNLKEPPVLSSTITPEVNKRLSLWDKEDPYADFYVERPYSAIKKGKGKRK